MYEYVGIYDVELKNILFLFYYMKTCFESRRMTFNAILMIILIVLKEKKNCPLLTEVISVM